MSDIIDKAVTWQKLMDTAYEKWPEKTTKREFLKLLTEPERAAVLLGNANYQIENGGHTQWVDNGYALSGYDLLDVLADLAGAPTTNPEAATVIREWRRQIRALLAYVDMGVKDRGFHDYWLHDDDYDAEDGEGDYDSPGQVYARSLDDWYYGTVQPALVPAVEAYLVTLSGQSN